MLLWMEYQRESLECSKYTPQWLYVIVCSNKFGSWYIVIMTDIWFIKIPIHAWLVTENRVALFRTTWRSPCVVVGYWINIFQTTLDCTFLLVIAVKNKRKFLMCNSNAIYTSSRRDNRPRCHQWQKSWHHNISFSVLEYLSNEYGPSITA